MIVLDERDQKPACDRGAVEPMPSPRERHRSGEHRQSGGGEERDGPGGDVGGAATTIGAVRVVVTMNVPIALEGQLTDAEVADLTSRNVISKPKGRGGRRVNPWVYTDYGVAIASTLFKDPRAIKITRMITEAFVDGANAVTETPRSAPEILPPQDAAAPLLPNGDQLRALAENILDSGQQSLVDYIANPTTKRQQAVAVIMKTLAETAGEEVRTQRERLRLRIAERLATGDYTDDDDRKRLIELLHAMKG